MTLTTKHTPGPWKLVDGWDKDGKGDCFPHIEMPGTKYYLVISLSHNQEKESIMANAELIATAPETAVKLENLIRENSHLQNEFIEVTKHLSSIVSYASMKEYDPIVLRQLVNQAKKLL